MRLNSRTMMVLSLTALAMLGNAGNLVQNPGFELGDKQPTGYALTGNVHWQATGYVDEIASPGVSLDAFAGGGPASGSVSQMVTLNPSEGKWVTFRFRGKAEDGFSVEKDALYMQLDFYADGGKRYLDTARRLIYREVLKDRKDLDANGNFRKGGAAVWRTYEFEELLPFAEADAVKISIGFENGTGKDKTYSRFLADDFEVTQSTASATGRQDPADRPSPAPTAAPDIKTLVPLGGRWYYRPAAGEKVGGPLTVTEANADRLFYRDDRLVNPFAGNMVGRLMKGYLDRDGKLVEKERVVPDNVSLIFDGSGMVTIRTHNLPNHPTAKFPDTYGTQGYNSGYIQEQDDAYRLPLVPQRNPQAFAMTENNSNYGLPMGTVGIAVNGVSFFNPFDGNMTDASSIMDRCCGHPNPQENRYHYHKYPVCVNTPFVDKGEGHSPILGFAFDGFPVYGPYESKGVMAKDLTTNKLDAFNAHQDPVRGWHYHVTPGKFPYIIGGYMGRVVTSNLAPPFRRVFGG